MCLELARDGCESLKPRRAPLTLFMKIKFVPQDLWIGLYWKRQVNVVSGAVETTWYLCIVPTLPIIWKTSRA